MKPTGICEKCGGEFLVNKGGLCDNCTTDINWGFKMSRYDNNSKGLFVPKHMTQTTQPKHNIAFDVGDILVDKTHAIRLGPDKVEFRLDEITGEFVYSGEQITPSGLLARPQINTQMHFNQIIAVFPANNVRWRGGFTAFETVGRIINDRVWSKQTDAKDEYLADVQKERDEGKRFSF